MSLSIAQIIRASLESIRSHLLFYLALAALCYVVSLFVDYVFVLLGKMHFMNILLLSILGTAIYARQSVVVHRSVILDEAGSWRQVFHWGVEDSIFFAVGVGLWLAFAFVAGLLLNMIESMVSINLISSTAIQWVDWSSFAVLMVMAGMVFTLICLYFPAVATNRKLTMAESAVFTKKHFKQVFFLVWLLPLFGGLLVEFMVFENSWILTRLIQFLTHVLMVYYVSVLSHTYLQLIGEQPQTAAE